MSSGPEVHPAQAEERDPPSTPAALTLLVGTAILVVIVFALEVLHVAFLQTEAAVPVVDQSPAAVLRQEQVSNLEAGRIPQDEGPARKGLPLDKAMDWVVTRYGKRN